MEKTKAIVKDNNKKRVSPVPDVDLFSFSSDSRNMLSSNFLENAEKLSKYALATYGQIGTIIKAREYPKIGRMVADPSEEEYRDLSAERINQLQNTLDIEWIKEKKKLKENKFKLFGFLMQLLIFFLSEVALKSQII